MALKQEILLLKGLDHPNIVKYIYTDTSKDKQGVDILLEYMPGGSVRSLLDKFGAFEESVIKTFIKQMLEGLKYLHSKGIIHRDLKCANVLVDDNFTIKLTDFGASKKVSFTDTSKNTEDITNELSKSLKGSPYWMAPEVVLRTGHNKSADIWSLGCVLIEMRTGHPPWYSVSNNAMKVLKTIATTKTGPPIPIDEFSIEARDFLNRCLKINPLHRSTAEELLSDKFMVNNNVKESEEKIKLMQSQLKYHEVKAHKTARRDEM
jgi:serine/threonine protein kinase